MWRKVVELFRENLFDDVQSKIKLLKLLANLYHYTQMQYVNPDNSSVFVDFSFRT